MKLHSKVVSNQIMEKQIDDQIKKVFFGKVFQNNKPLKLDFL